MSARSRFWLDAAIAAAFVVASNPPLTGQGVHEWLGVAFAAVVGVHVLFHWNWVACSTRRLFTRAGRHARPDYTVDAVLFVALTATILSGLLTSTHLWVSLGITVAPRPWWREVHSLGANTLVVAAGVHLGLHWDWLACHLRRVAGLAPRRVGIDRPPLPGYTPGAAE